MRTAADVTPVQLAAYGQALLQLERALKLDTASTIARITQRLGCNPSLEDLQRGCVRVLQGGQL